MLYFILCCRERYHFSLIKSCIQIYASLDYRLGGLKTACWFEIPSDTTVSLLGERSVPVKTTGHEKDHYTVILIAQASGKKMKPFVVFNGKGTQLLKKLKDIPGVIV